MHRAFNRGSIASRFGRRSVANSVAQVSLAVATASLLASGCQVSAPPVQTAPEVHARSDIAANSQQFRLRMRGLVQPLTGEIVASADQIIASTDDPAMRRGALLWKIEAVPALREALFQPDPVTALTDAWVLSFQMADYFRDGPGKASLGAAHTIAVATCERLEAEIARVAASLTISGEVSKARAHARTLAAERPIRHTIAARDSLLSKSLEREIITSFSPMDAAGSLTVSVDDLNRRLEIYSAQLMEQARWQAELFAMGLEEELQVKKAVPLTEAAVKSADRIADSLAPLATTLDDSLRPLQSLPEIITSERKAIVDAFSAQIARVLEFIQGERVATLKQFTEERLATARDIRSALDEERRLIRAEVGQLIDQAVDRAFLRGAQIGAVALAAIFVGIVVLMFLLRWMLVRPTRIA